MKASYELMDEAARQMLGKMLGIMDAMTVSDMNETEFNTFYDGHVSPLVLAAFEYNFAVECFDSQDMYALQERNWRAARHEWNFRTKQGW